MIPWVLHCVILSTSGDQFPVNTQETGKPPSNNVATDRKIVVESAPLDDSIE